MDEEISKERSEIPEPPSLTVGDVRYVAVPWGKARGLGQNGGYIAALDAGGRELWLLKVYDIVYDGDMEEDKQDRFIDSIFRDGADLLRITDERGGVYRVNTKTRTVVA